MPDASELRIAHGAAAGVGPWVSMRLVWCFRQVTHAYGLDSLELWASEGYTAEDLADLDLRLPLGTVERLLTAAIEVTGADDIGLRAAEAAEPGFFDIVEYAARTQPTMGHALDCLCRLVPILADHSDLRAETQGSVATIDFIPHFGVTPHAAMIDFTFAQLQLFARRLTGVPALAPTGVHLRRVAPPDRSRYASLFQAPVYFGAKLDQMVFPAEQLALPLVTADSRLSALLDRVVKDVLADVSRDYSIAERVRNLLVEHLHTGEASASKVARRLGLTPRTLHRRLAAEGKNLRELTDEVRHTLAVAYLKEPRLSIGEVAYLLGFASVTAFHRAFRRWTGHTPQVFRRASAP